MISIETREARIVGLYFLLLYVLTTQQIILGEYAPNRLVKKIKGTNEILLFELVAFSISDTACLRVKQLAFVPPSSGRIRPSVNGQIAIVSGHLPGIKVIGICTKFMNKIPVPGCLDTTLKGKNSPKQLISWKQPDGKPPKHPRLII